MALRGKEWELQFSTNEPSAPLEQPFDPAALAHCPELFQWFAERFAAQERMPQAVPQKDIQRVAELAPHLYEPYRIDDGTVRLAGCTLENRYFFRDTLLHVQGGEVSLVHIWSDAQCRRVGDDLRERLTLDQLIPASRPFVDPSLGELVRNRSRPAAGNGAETTWLLTTLVAVKWARGKLEFVQSDTSVSLEFSGWAQELANKTASLPPYTCPVTNRQGYEMVRAATGELTVREAVGECALSGERRLVSDLGTCVVSGLQVARDNLEICPISHELLLPQEFTSCAMCGEPVSPLVIAGDRCRACRQLQPVPSDDPRICRLTAAHEDLRSLHRWSLSETDRVLVAVGSRWWRETLVVVDRQTLELRRISQKNRWQRNWTRQQSSPD